MATLFCHWCERFYSAPLFTVLVGCWRCRRPLDQYEPHHVLRGRQCRGGCGTRLVVTFEPSENPAGTPLCPRCLTPWSSLKAIERDGIRYEPILRVDPTR